MKHIPQIAAAIFFLALLATPLVLKPYYVADSVTFDKAASTKKFGLYFEEIAKNAGVEFVHKAPVLDPKLNNIMPQIASMGAGVAVSDFNNDGWNDFYLTNSGRGSTNALYQNNKDGTFTDVAGRTGVAGLNKKGASMGAVWGDFDNDGYEDLLVYKWGTTELYKNNKGESFSKVDTAALPEWANINTGIWVDFDRDGRLDIFLGGYFRPEIDLWNLRDTKIMPESFEYAGNGGRNYLLRNTGDGGFEDVTEKMGLTSTRWTLAAAAADINDDGFSDLFVSNDYGVSELYLNDKGKRFIDIGEQSGVGFSPKSGMNASFGDVLNDGKLAIYESNIYEEGNLLQGNNLWMPTRD
ncbi:MAG: VCBS repeat-containing protein, partial [Acidobacteriota bacterium]|nr:VCBS repeat-containing protein [Acidobacteriota bacterium]